MKTEKSNCPGRVNDKINYISNSKLHVSCADDWRF